MTRFSKFSLSAALCVCLMTLSSVSQAQCLSRTSSQAETRVIEVYLAYYGRLPDSAGFNYWSEQLEAQGGNLAEIIQAFGVSSEFEDRYGDLGGETLITNIYQQLFNRDPDPAGLAFYLAKLNAGEMSLQTITLNVLDGAVDSDLTVIQNKVEAAENYLELDNSGLGRSLGESSLSYLAKTVTETGSSVSSSCAAAIRLVTLADLPTMPVDSDYQDTYAYRSGAEFSEVMPACVSAQYISQICPYELLPLIGMDHPDPDIDDVMRRVIVSHDWMGLRFEQWLETMPKDMLLMFRGVNAIVIDSDIRPSYYSATGAIYLDPARLWLTNAEKEVIGREPDYRSGFGSELLFNGSYEHTKNGDWAWRFYSLFGTEERTIEDIRYPMASLLFHELAHANDYQSPALINAVSRLSDPYYSSIDFDHLTAATALNNYEPLDNTVLKGLAGVSFRGNEATAAEKALTAAEVGPLFEFDGAADYYSYTSDAEDVAMLFTEVMLKHHFNIDRYMYFYDLNEDAEFCDDYMLQWGQKSRAGASHVAPRAGVVGDVILPEVNFSEDYIASMGPAVPLQTGMGICSSISQAAVGTSAAPRSKKQMRSFNELVSEQPQYRHTSRRMLKFDGE